MNEHDDSLVFERNISFLNIFTKFVFLICFFPLCIAATERDTFFPLLACLVKFSGMELKAALFNNIRSRFTAEPKLHCSLLLLFCNSCSPFYHQSLFSCFLPPALAKGQCNPISLTSYLCRPSFVFLLPLSPWPPLTLFLLHLHPFRPHLRSSPPRIGVSSVSLPGAGDILLTDSDYRWHRWQRSHTHRRCLTRGSHYWVQVDVWAMASWKVGSYWQRHTDHSKLSVFTGWMVRRMAAGMR